MEVDLPIAGAAIDEMVADAVKKVFSTMLQIDVEHEKTLVIGDDGIDESEQPLPVNCPMVAGSVGFIGSVNGVIYLFFEETIALELTGSFLGMTAEEVEQEDHETINDALGEMTNMIVGTFKNRLCDHGLNCRLTVPSILRGNTFCIETTSSVVQRFYHFSYGGCRFGAELFLKPGE